MRLALPTSRRTRFAAVAAIAWLGLIGALLVPQLRQATDVASAETEACPPGYHLAAQEPVLGAPDELAQRPAMYRGPVEAELPDVLRKITCLSDSGPESFAEMAAAAAQRSAIRTAPFDSVAPGANEAAFAQRQELVDSEVPGADGTFEKYGLGPLDFADPRYDRINGLGLTDQTGRVDEFEYFRDETRNYLFAAIGTGGIWLSEDLGQTFRSVGDSLPTQVVGSVAFTPAGGPQGTIATITGEHTFGGNGYIGQGAFYSRDLGATWQRAEGVPSAGLGFAIEVDPTDPTHVLAASQFGLFRSTDAGVTYENVNLPTGDCEGVVDDRDDCNFANMVSDVVFKEPGGLEDAEDDVPAGTVVATVGWRAGMMENPDGSIQSPNNGVYRSETGEPGSFERLDGLDATVGGKERIGRVEMGPTVGPEQDHDYLYAVVEDAVLFNGGFPILDIPADEPEVEVEGIPVSANTTVLNSIVVSDDFGESWATLEDQEQLAAACPTTGSALCIPGLINPGVQAWYDQWIAPDPTKTAPGGEGIPSRVVFGLEEIWQNVRGVAATDTAPAEQPVDNNSVSFEVFGRYFSGDTCAFGLIPVPGEACPVARPPAGSTTTHPDQHAGIFLPLGDETGTVRLLVGHDGGISMQDRRPDQEFNNGEWKLDQENGLETLLPYSAVWANDGVAWAGLQDNGHMRIDPEEDFRKFATFGGDGTFAAVVAEDSDTAYESVQGGRMNVTEDGGENWARMESPAEGKRFVNPFVLDPTDENHLATGGFQITETVLGPDTGTGGWVEVFDLNTPPEGEMEDSADVNVDSENGMSAIDTLGRATYVGFCGACDILDSEIPFASGIATNVGGDEPPAKASPVGWHKTAAEGLPERFVTSVAIDPNDVSRETIYVTLGGYSRRWVPPGSVNDENPDVGEGHVFKSTDAGETFTDISGDLPDIPAAWVEPRGDQLIIGTDNGIYLSSDTEGGAYAVLGGGQLPAVPISSIMLKPDDPNRALVGTYGRGLHEYVFPSTETITAGLGADARERELRRVAGVSRIETSVETSQELFESATTVVLTRGDEYADALAGAPLARTLDAPVLITPSDEIAPAVEAEIDRLGASEVVVLGGTDAINASVVDELEAKDLEVDRVGGANRFGTAALIAEELGGGTDVYIAEGGDAEPSRGWPDALSIAPVAAKQQRPILLVTTESMPEETAQALDDLGVESATVIGGTGAVGPNPLAALDERQIERRTVAGADRFGTSAEVAELAEEEAGMTVENLWLARGSDWPDSLSAGPTVAKTNGILVLVADDDLANSPQTRDFIDARACDVAVARVLGGVEAISPAVEAALRALILDVDCPTPVPMTRDVTPTVFTPSPLDTDDAPAEPEGVTVAGPFTFDDGADGFTTAFTGVPSTRWRQSDGAFVVRPYGDNGDATLTSPEIEWPGGFGFLSFGTANDTEAGFDGYAVEVSSDGETYSAVGNVSGTSEGYPELAQEQLVFQAPEGPLFLRFRFTSDLICSSGTEAACADPGEMFEGSLVDDVVVLK